ncbi:unnamed protein product [Bursaphelenchus xylophilus]|uniref:Tubulin-specific chaperone E n=1 Tax=Bursaphelenchus xylophilus TaxID=6326 RepID=A0A1I7S4Y1_BURXY|nr:unnamed protein product [Bursaphelenchus xylophilus]CAG9117491.1 unnamed protein product [Bursaphelenchus xylophilus]
MTIRDSPSIGDRVGVDQKRGFIRYIGSLHIAPDSNEVWLGIEWDNPGEGKHDGVLQGKRYFSTKYPDSGSFVRLKDVNLGQGFLKTVEDHYSGKDDQLEGVEIVLKEAELDFNWIYQQRLIVLENKFIRFLERDVSQNFPKCIELSMARNMLSDWNQVFRIIDLFPSLVTLDISLNKLKPLEPIDCVYPTVESLNVVSCGLDVKTVSELHRHFPNLKKLFLVGNELEEVPDLTNLVKLEVLDLSKNPLVDFKKVSKVKNCSRLNTLNLKECGFRSVEFDEDVGFPSLECLWLDGNPIGDWESINQIARLPSLKNLRSGDLYTSDRNLQAYEILIAKLPTINILNGCIVSPWERSNCEKFFQLRFSEPPIPQVHEKDVQRFNAKYGPVYEKPPEGKYETQQRKISLTYNGKTITRTLQLSLNIEHIVAMASRLLRFEPSKVEVKVEVQKGVFDSVEWNSSVVLRSFEPEDGMEIVFSDA